jgi:hypothetical protein
MATMSYSRIKIRDARRRFSYRTQSPIINADTVPCLTPPASEPEPPRFTLRPDLDRLPEPDIDGGFGKDPT